MNFREKYSGEQFCKKIFWPTLDQKKIWLALEGKTYSGQDSPVVSRQLYLVLLYAEYIAQYRPTRRKIVTLAICLYLNTTIVSFPDEGTPPLWTNTISCLR